MQLKLYVPKLLDLNTINKVMLDAPHGQLMAEQVYGDANDLFSMVAPQIYYNVMEDNKIRQHLSLNDKVKQYLVDENLNELLSCNHDVLYCLAEELAQEELARVGLDTDEVQLLNCTEKHMSDLIVKHNQWDMHINNNQGTLQWCISQMYDITANAILTPLVDSFTHKYQHAPSEIEVNVLSPTVLGVRCPTF